MKGRQSWPFVLLALGFVVSLVAGVTSGQYRPGWFDPGDGPSCQCSPDEAAAGLAWSWAWIGVGVAVVVGGLVWLAFTLPTTRGRTVGGPAVLALGEALLAAVVGFVLPVALFFPWVFLLIVSEGLTPALVLLGWLAHAVVISVLDRLVGPAWSSPRSSYLVGLGVGAVGFGSALALFWTNGPDGGQPALIDAFVCGLTMLALRIPPGRRQGRAVPAVAVLRAVLLVVVAIVVVWAFVWAVVSSDRSRYGGFADSGAADPPVAGVLPDLPSTAAPSPAPLSTAPPTVPPTGPEPVVADVPCPQSDLTFRVSGVDGAMGARAASIVATNTGTSACWLEGVPIVVLLQDGRPLALQVGPGQTPDGTPASAQRVGVAPGSTAFALLTWRSYGGWADLESPQEVTVALDPSSTLVPAPFAAGAGAAPLDIADGGAWGIAPWVAG